MVTYTVLEVITGTGAEFFNFAFTTVSVFGFVSLAVGCLVSIIRGS